MIALTHYDVIRSPVITEKSTARPSRQGHLHGRTDATKAEIKAAVEALFKVKVKACAANPGDLKAVYKLARHAGLGLGPNIYLAIHAPTQSQRAAALKRFEDTCDQVNS